MLCNVQKIDITKYVERVSIRKITKDRNLVHNNFVEAGILN